MVLQAELPYKSKPKNMLPRKRPTLEQRRAVVLEPGEKKAVTLVQQLNALRNVKEAKRKEQQARKREVRYSNVIHGQTFKLVVYKGWLRSVLPVFSEDQFLLSCLQYSVSTAGWENLSTSLACKATCKLHDWRAGSIKED